MSHLHYALESRRPGRARALRSIIRHMKEAEEALFATGSAIAR